MTTMILSLFNPNSLLPHRAGVAGLALALSTIDQTDAPLKGDFSDDEVKLAWNCTDQEAIEWLLRQTYQIKNGYLDVKALKLDEPNRYIFTEGVTTTFLQHSKQRSFDQQTTTLNFQVDEGQPELQVSYRPLLSCYYTNDFKEAFNNKGQFKKTIPLKGHHLPGLVEDFANGAYQESPENYLSLLFLPIACQYFRLPGFLSALVIPSVTNLIAWVKRRRQATGKTVQKLTPYGLFRANGAGESALRFLLQETLIEDSQAFRVDYCEVYRLGKQPWDGNQSYLKQEVYRVNVTDQVLELYQNAWQLFPSIIRKNDKGETWLATSQVLPWIADNLIKGNRWYQGFFEFRKANEIYERKGLIKMTQIDNSFTDHEKAFFDAIQGAFGKSWREEKDQHKDNPNQADYESVYKKALYRLQRPNTQMEFARAVVLFLGRYNSKSSTGFGEEIYLWLHRENKWRKARDLAVLAISTYGKKKSKEESHESGENTDLTSFSLED